MKQLILTLILVTLSAPVCFGEWTKTTEAPINWGCDNCQDEDAVFYVDFDRIREHGGYVYWWDLISYLTPPRRGLGTGFMSIKSYKQGDCGMFGFKYLARSYHLQPMGKEDGELPDRSADVPDSIWRFPPPETIEEFHLKLACAQVKLKKNKE